MLIFRALYSAAEYHAMWMTALRFSWNNGENSTLNVFIADDLYGPFLPHCVEPKGGQQNALTS